MNLSAEERHILICLRNGGGVYWRGVEGYWMSIGTAHANLRKGPMLALLEKGLIEENYASWGVFFLLTGEGREAAEGLE